MPQYLAISLEDGTQTELITRNQGSGCSYRISWLGEDLGIFDTGVATQRDADSRTADNKCDFTHVRRGLAAMTVAAPQIISTLAPETCPFRYAEIVLCTNHLQRGRIVLRAEDGDLLSMEVRIGGANGPRFHPKTEFILGPEQVARPEARSRLELVFLVIVSQSKKVLNLLAPHKQVGSAQP